MKFTKKFSKFFILAVLTILTVQSAFAQRFAVATGNWASTTTWSTTRGGASGASAPTSTTDVTIPSGFTVTLDGNRLSKNLTIETGGILESNAAVGSPWALRIAGTTVDVAGTLGGTSNSIASSISLEPNTTTGQIEIKGGGTINIARIKAFIAGTSTKINTDVTLSATTLNFMANNLDNTTLEIAAGKTATLSGHITTGTAAATDPTMVTNLTINVYGTITGANFLNLSTISGATSNCTVYKGGILSFNHLYANATATGVMNLKIEEGSTVTINNSTTNAPNCSVEFATAATGSTGAGITASSKLATVKNLTINNTGDVTLSSNVTVNGTLTLTTGKVIIQGNNLTVAEAGSISGGSSTSFVLTDNTAAGAVGRLVRTTSTGTMLFFPVGINASSYDPVEITPGSGTQTFGVKVDNAIAAAASLANATKIYSREWNIDRVAGSGSATLSLTAGGGTPGSFNAANPVVIGHHTGTAWEEFAATLSGLKFTATATSFSPFVVGNASSVLPVELKNFDVKAVKNTTNLTWTTASEKDNAQFDIQHSANGIDFQTISTVKGQGTTNTETAYNYVHTTPSVGVNYYRLKQVDYNSISTHSPVRSVVFGKSGLTLKTTLVQTGLTIVASGDEAVNMGIFNIAGQQVLTTKIQGEQMIDVSSLPSGLYFVKVADETARFVKQ